MDEFKEATELNKKQLIAMDIDEVLELEEEKISDTELLARASDAMIFYNHYFKKVLKLLVFEQMKWGNTQARTPDEMLINKGSINGLYIVEEWFKEQLSKEASKRQQEESFKNVSEGK